MKVADLEMARLQVDNEFYEQVHDVVNKDGSTSIILVYPVDQVPFPHQLVVINTYDSSTGSSISREYAELG